jgi:hypothetical protein
LLFVVVRVGYYVVVRDLLRCSPRFPVSDYVVLQIRCCCWLFLLLLFDVVTLRCGYVVTLFIVVVVVVVTLLPSLFVIRYLFRLHIIRCCYALFFDVPVCSFCSFLFVYGCVVVLLLFTFICCCPRYVEPVVFGCYFVVVC